MACESRSTPRPGTSSGRAAEAGFTLVELLLVILMTTVLVLGVLGLFDGMNRMARVQTHMSEMQQSQRVAQDDLVRTLRMAGRGGVADQPLGNVVSSLAPVTVRNNVGLGGGSQVVVDGEAVEARSGSDVLVVRGVFSTPVYRLDYVDAGSYDPVNRRVVVRNVTPTGVPQDLTPLREAIDEARPEALVLTDALGDAWGVAELDPGASTASADRVELAFRTSGTARANRYAALSRDGVFPSLTKALTVGLLEEHRYYVRDADPAPRLARARTYPASEEVWDGQLEVLVAENVLDLQVALGFDSSLAGGFFDCDDDAVGDDDRIVETADGTADDWLFNAPGPSAGEDASAAPWTVPGGGWTAVVSSCGDKPRPALYYVRVATLVRSPQPDPKYQAPVLETLADRTYPLAADDPVNGREARLHRRRILETTVDLRNL